MQRKVPKPEEWRRLYDAATRVKALAPWDFLEETDVFGVRDPDTEKVGFVSVMGVLGEHHGVSLYLGTEGLRGFRVLQEEGPELTAEQILEIPQLQASFEDRSQLDEEDLSVIKSLGLRFRGRAAWPVFRSYRPGFSPWFLEAGETRFLACALEELAEVASCLQKDPSLLQKGGEGCYLVRTRLLDVVGSVWEKVTLGISVQASCVYPAKVDDQAIAEAMTLPKRKQELEVDVFLVPASIGKKGERPLLPYALLLVDSQSGIVEGFELLVVESTVPELWACVPVKILGQLARMGYRPAFLKSSSERLMGLLEPLARKLQIRVKRSRRLPRLQAARLALLEHMASPS